MSLATMLTSIVSHLQTSVSQEKLSASRVRQVTTTICKVQEYVRALSKLHLDPKEFALLKAIALFGAGTKILLVHMNVIFRSLGAILAFLFSN